MAAKRIAETDVIEVKSLVVIVYGPPGAGKTSLAQTADQPFTLDFDAGIHRSFNRKLAMQFDQWSDVDEAKEEIRQCKTVVVDTVGRLLDTMSAEIIRANPKHGTFGGGLALQGYGVLKSRFGQWVAQLRTAGKDIVLLAHEKEEKDGDDRIMRPDVQGGSYTECHKVADIMAYLYRDRQGVRTLDANPSDRHTAKNAAGWAPIRVPKLEDDPRFLANLLADAKGRIGKTAAASAELAKASEEWAAWLGRILEPAELNGRLIELPTMAPHVKKAVWHLMQERAGAGGWTFDAGRKLFVANQQEA